MVGVREQQPLTVYIQLYSRNFWGKQEHRYPIVTPEQRCPHNTRYPRGLRLRATFDAYFTTVRMSAPLPSSEFLMRVQCRAKSIRYTKMCDLRETLAAASFAAFKAVLPVMLEMLELPP